MRLNAYLARAGVLSRRGADELIKAGRVEVNGKTAQLNTEASSNDEVKVDGNAVRLQKMRCILLYKPTGYVSTLKDPHGRRKVIDLIDIEERVVPVGRLDYDTTGVLLLTNDGELAYRLMHPSFEASKVYEAEVRGAVSQKILNRLSNGVELDGKMTAPARIRKLSDNKIELIIHEGRYHQVRRMLAALGLQVTSLHRSRYGDLNLTGLKPGQWRELTPVEVAKLRS